MGTELKRLTFSITPDMAEQLACARAELFRDSTQSEMFRELLSAGLRAAKTGRGQTLQA